MYKMLPQPSSLSLKGSSEDQIRYVVSYLERLVKELDRQINRGAKTSTESVRVVRDIGFADDKLAIHYTDGAVKYIAIGE